MKTEPTSPTQALLPNGEAKAPTKQVPKSGIDVQLPHIVVNGRPLQYVTRDAMKALAAANRPPTLFQRGLSLVRVVQDDRKHPELQQMDYPMLRGHMARSAIYLRIDKKGESTVVPPPSDVVGDLNAMPDWEGTFPPIEAINQTPALRADGSILAKPGYDPETRLFYVPPENFKMAPLPDRPTKDDVRSALTVIEDVIGEFPFASAAARANAYGLLLTPFLRPVLTGEPVPLALLDAPQQGTGKSLYARVVATLATGSDATGTAAGSDEAEWRKAITSTLLHGTTFVQIDNITTTLRSDALSAVLTTSTWRDRVLGASKEVTLPNRATWCATGNNIRVAGDLIRRCYRIRIDAQTSRPWLRKAFKHPELISYVRQVRTKVLAAALILCRSWFAAGCPESSATPRLGNFERWSSVVGGVLEHAGIRGFLSDLDSMYEESDDESSEWEEFLDALNERFRGITFSVGDILADIEKNEGIEDVLRDALPASLADALESRRGFRSRLGKALKAHVDARYGTDQLYLTADRTGGHEHKLVYRVERVAPAARRNGDRGRGAERPRRKSFK